MAEATCVAAPTCGPRRFLLRLRGRRGVQAGRLPQGCDSFGAGCFLVKHLRGFAPRPLPRQKAGEVGEGLSPHPVRPRLAWDPNPWLGPSQIVCLTLPHRETQAQRQQASCPKSQSRDSNPGS